MDAQERIGLVQDIERVLRYVNAIRDHLLDVCSLECGEALVDAQERIGLVQDIERVLRYVNAIRDHLLDVCCLECGEALGYADVMASKRVCGGCIARKLRESGGV